MTILSFESCRLSLRTRQLVVGDRPVDLQPLVFDVIAYLAQNPRRLVSKDELLQAVWRSSQVSESVVARAIMKSRRAIGDSAATPRWLHTLHGRGYRLDVEVALLHDPPKPVRRVTEPSSPASDVALLPWWNHTGDDSLDWTSLGLSSLVHHLVDQAGGPKLAPMAATAALWRSLDPDSDVLQAACDALGVREALACTLERGGPGWALTIWRGSSTRSAVETVLASGDIVRLAAQLTEAMTGHPLPPEALPADPFWGEQLAQAIGLSETGNSRQALELLTLCLPHFRPSAHVMLLKARLIYRGADAEATIAAAQQAIDLATRDGALVVNVRAHATMAYALRDLGRFDEAIAQCEAALKLTDQTPQALTLRPRVLDCLSLTAMEQGRTQLAVEAVEEGVALSEVLGQVEDEANALVTAAFVYGQADRIDPAAAACERAAKLAQRSGNLILKANVLRAQAVVLQWQQRPRAALDVCRRSLALWARSGHQVGRDWAMAHALELMCEAGDLDAFEADYLAFIAQPALSPAMRHSARSSHATWLWKQGHRQRAADALSSLAADIGGDALQMRNSVGDELVFMLAQLREIDMAQFELARLPAADRPIRRARSRAALELAAGNPAAAIRLLRQTWESKDGYGVGAADLLADHAWLLLEQWSPGDSTDELESLHAHALDHSDDYLPGALFRAAWRLRSDPQVDHAGQWDAAVRRAEGRLRSFAWITEPAFREQLASGTPRALPVLLTRALD